MPRDWKGPYRRRMQERASERGRRMARARWAIDRQRRDRLAALAPERDCSRILKRVVVIWEERDVYEAVIRPWDSEREARRKERAVLRRPSTLNPQPSTAA